MTSSYWGFLLMNLHLGLHWGLLVSLGRRVFGIRSKSRARSAGFILIGAAITLYGISACVRRNLLLYLLIRTQFVFLDFGESKIVFYLDYLAMAGGCIFLSHFIGKLLQKAVKKRNNKMHCFDFLATALPIIYLLFLEALIL